MQIDPIEYQVKTFFYKLSEQLWEAFAEEVRKQGKLSKEHDLASRREFATRKATELVATYLKTNL